MKISAAMCTYNGERFLEAQLRSIARQTSPPMELVVCDDGSTDTTVEIVERFARSAPFPVRLVRNSANLRSTGNFEKAIGLCKGEAIALCDQDDLWMPNKLAAAAAILDRESEVAGVFSDALLIDDAGALLPGTLWGSVRFTAPERQAFSRDQSLFLIQRPAVTGAAFVFRSRFRDAILPIPPEWVHDAWIAAILASVAKLRAIAEPLISYRLHASQQLGVRVVRERLGFWKGKGDRIALHRSKLLVVSQIADRLQALGVSTRGALYAKDKAAYMTKRIALLELGRFPRLVRGTSLLRGHFRFGLGLVSYLLDIIHA